MKQFSRDDFRKALKAGHYTITDIDNGLAVYVTEDRAGRHWGMKLVCDDEGRSRSEVVDEALECMAPDQHPRLMAKIGDRFFWK